MATPDMGSLLAFSQPQKRWKGNAPMPGTRIMPDWRRNQNGSVVGEVVTTATMYR
jgi:hypothetical protein